jgi:hypothetical protein
MTVLVLHLQVFAALGAMIAATEGLRALHQQRKFPASSTLNDELPFREPANEHRFVTRLRFLMPRSTRGESSATGAAGRFMRVRLSTTSPTQG